MAANLNQTVVFFSGAGGKNVIYCPALMIEGRDSKEMSYPIEKREVYRVFVDFFVYMLTF